MSKLGKISAFALALAGGLSVIIGMMIPWYPLSWIGGGSIVVFFVVGGYYATKNWRKK